MKGQGAPFPAPLSADGKRVLTASLEEPPRIWDVESGKEIAVLTGHKLPTTASALSADGKRAVVAFLSSAEVWDVESGNLISVLRGHAAALSSAAFGNDGERVLTSSYDNTTRMWDVGSGKEIAVLHTDEVDAVALSSDNTRIVTTSSDKTARIWDVSWAMLVRGDALRERVCAEKLVGAAQQFTVDEIRDDPILRGIDEDDAIARNPCQRRGPLSLDYWTRLPGQLWRSTRRLVN
jgi:hypothetical protein